MRPAVLAGALLAAASLGCGDADPLGPRTLADLRTELVIESAPPGLEGAVAADSASWYPAAVLATSDARIVEIEGPYRFRLRSAAPQGLSLRYDLRFFDVDRFLVDRFIPFGQPLLLGAGQATLAQGTFAIRAPIDVGRYGLATMLIAVRVEAVP